MLSSSPAVEPNCWQNNKLIVSKNCSYIQYSVFLRRSAFIFFINKHFVFSVLFFNSSQTITNFKYLLFFFFYFILCMAEIESLLSLSPNYKQLPPLVVTPPTIDERFRYNNRSDQQIYNFRYRDQPMSPNSQPNIMQRRPHRQQQSFELIESNQLLAKRNKFRTSKVEEDINIPASTSSSDRSDSDIVRIHPITH